MTMYCGVKDASGDKVCVRRGWAFVVFFVIELHRVTVLVTVDVHHRNWHSL